MPYTIINKQRIFYTEHRPGVSCPLLLLVHGAGGTHDHWPPQVRRLSGLAVLALDLPGHGRSEGEGHQSIADYARDMLAFLDALGISQVVLVGHSMGGAIVQTLGLTAPDRIVGIVLVGTGVRLRVAPQILEGIRSAFDETVELILSYAYGPDVHPDLVALGRRSLHATPPEALHGDYLACDRFDVMEEIGQIRVPVLVISGAADRLTPPKYAHYLVEHLPNAELELVEGAGHMVMIEQPETVSRLIRRWVERHWPMRE